ncbi:hypothetical protein JCM8547_000320 [Rhodosporidiobolus lusitaniae]
MLRSALLLASVASMASAHMTVWTPAMYGVGEGFEYIVPGQPSDPIGPDLSSQDDWWFRGPEYRALAPSDRSDGTYGHSTTDPGSNLDACPGNVGAYHAGDPNADEIDLSLVSGCALAIADVDNIDDVTMDNLAVFSVQPNCVQQKQTYFDIPAKMPACTGEKCICAWLWLANNGTANFYMTGFDCAVTGSPADALPIAAPQDPVYCADGSSACVQGALRPLYTYNTPTNVPYWDNDARPGYDSRYGFHPGAQNNIFVAAPLAVNVTTNATASTSSTSSSSAAASTTTTKASSTVAGSISSSVAPVTSSSSAPTVGVSVSVGLGASSKTSTTTTTTVRPTTTSVAASSSAIPVITTTPIRTTSVAPTTTSSVPTVVRVISTTTTTVKTTTVTPTTTTVPTTVRPSTSSSTTSTIVRTSSSSSSTSSSAKTTTTTTAAPKTTTTTTTTTVAPVKTTTSASTVKTTTTTVAPTPTAAKNLALTATAQASSEWDTSPASAVNDGKIGGYLSDTEGDESQEWSSYTETAGAWVTLSWPSSVSFNQVVLYDRPNDLDQVLAGNVTFANGQGVSFGELVNDGSATYLNLSSTVKTTSLKVYISAASDTTQNSGLSEIQVFLANSAKFPTSTRLTPTTPVIFKATTTTAAPVAQKTPSRNQDKGRNGPRHARDFSSRSVEQVAERALEAREELTAGMLFQ